MRTEVLLHQETEGGNHADASVRELSLTPLEDLFR